MTAAEHIPHHQALVREAGRVRLRVRPTHAPAPGELLVAVQVAGLCGTDIQMLRGLRDDPAPVIGHEGICHVVAAGTGAPDSLSPGTPVLVNPTHRSDPSFLLGHNVDGLMQERTHIPATAVHDGLVVPLTQPPDPVLGTLIEPLAAVCYAFALLGTVGPRTLVVYGDGTIGQLAVRAARRWLGEDVRVVLVHHSRDGLEWSARHPVAGTELLLDGEGHEALRLDGPTAVLLATPRTGTLNALESALRLDCRDLTIDMFGGLPPGATSALLPGVDLAAVRAANCAGLPVPAAFTRVRGPQGRSVRLTGHRGVGNDHLLEAAAELAGRPDLYRDLVTHVVEPREAAKIMNSLSAGLGRNVAGSRLIKLAVQFPRTPPSSSLSSESA
ncbi:alcohol dehydrogenase catalytic domain-containing protein [Streptomyces violascens]|uniref:Alcohol dehydrogenase-like N-terminal domain-containing protein n=1 Tax=Streptomyces violascens TaxID=67381 RepID=A0ABQ3R298_9ACTN|nr:alcohol dehydrogenase catalytic domain-containing protein [Streptomyces violascens]GGU32475.1 hypothetical protein GCM10010289_62220 [Streptomyces violascens]GHI43647.1 hypothetical protein Sviol_80550 [Streptomyces violascens]